MSIIQAIRISRAPMAGLAIVGIFFGAFAALVPDIKAAAHASDAQMGAALIFSSIGGMLSMYLAPRVGALLGRRILPLAGAAVVLASFYPIFPTSVPALALALFGMGASVSMLDMSANVRISVLEDRHALHLMNVNHAAFSFAFAAAAFATSLARKAGFGPSAVLPVVAIIVAAMTLLMIEDARWTPAKAAEEGADTRSPWPVILPAAAVLFAAFVSENATESWSALFIERTLHALAGDGGFGPMMLGLTMGVGRLSGQFAAAKLGEAGLVMASAVVAVIGALVLATSQSPEAAITGIGFLGLGVAVVVPSANSILGKLVRPDQRGIAISRAWLIGFTGFFLGPSTIGYVSQNFGLRVAFLGVACVLASIIPATRLMQRRGAKPKLA